MTNVVELDGGAELSNNQGGVLRALEIYETSVLEGFKKAGSNGSVEEPLTIESDFGVKILKPIDFLNNEANAPIFAEYVAKQGQERLQQVVSDIVRAVDVEYQTRGSIKWPNMFATSRLRRCAMTDGLEVPNTNPNREVRSGPKTPIQPEVKSQLEEFVKTNNIDARCADILLNQTCNEDALAILKLGPQVEGENPSRTVMLKLKDISRGGMGRPQFQGGRDGGSRFGGRDGGNRFGGRDGGNRFGGRDGGNRFGGRDDRNGGGFRGNRDFGGRDNYRSRDGDRPSYGRDRYEGGRDRHEGRDRYESRDRYDSDRRRERSRSRSRSR